MSIRTRAGAVALQMAALAFVGCQSSGNANYPVRVTGKVTYNGSPVGGGVVTFHAADGTPIQVPIAPDGTYTADGLPEGAMAVTVETESVNRKQEEYRGQGGGGMMSKYGKGGGGGAAAPKGKGMQMSPVPPGAGGGVEPNYVKIPAKYADKATSGLSVTLKSGKQTYDIRLTD
jgi:hypothetical protein